MLIYIILNIILCNYMILKKKEQTIYVMKHGTWFDQNM